MGFAHECTSTDDVHLCLLAGAVVPKVAQGQECRAGKTCILKKHKVAPTKGPIGDPQGARGALPQNPRNWEKSGKQFFKGGWGETGFPKGLLGTIQSILVTGNPLIFNFETNPPQNLVFPTSILHPITSLGQPGPNF